MSEHVMLMETDDETGERFPICPACTVDWPCVYADLAASRQREARLRDTLEEVHRYGLTIVGASEAYGETESAHLWNEVAALAEQALWPRALGETTAEDGPAGGGQREQRLADALGPLITHYRRHTDHRCEIYTDAQAALAEYEAPAEQRAGGE